jgi:hypothetical protein
MEHREMVAIIAGVSQWRLAIINLATDWPAPDYCHLRVKLPHQHSTGSGNSWGPDRVHQSLDLLMPELANAQVNHRKEGDQDVYRFQRRVRTKGA